MKKKRKKKKRSKYLILDLKVFGSHITKSISLTIEAQSIDNGDASNLCVCVCVC